MSQQSLEIKASAEYTILCTLTYGGDPDGITVKRYVRWTDDLAVGGELYSSMPSLDFTPSEQHGGTSDNAAKLEMSANAEPFDRMVLGYRHSTVKVQVDQINPRTLDSRRNLYTGNVALITKNPSGRAGLVRATLAGLKSRIADVKLSLAMTTTCQNEFGTDTMACRVPTEALWRREGSVTSIGDPSPNTVELDLTGITTPLLELANDRYRRGWVQVEGLKILIKRSLEDGRFELFSLPPPYWVGQNCIVNPGCDLRLETCRLWRNEENFNGLGIKVPARNPIYETGR